MMKKKIQKLEIEERNGETFLIFFFPYKIIESIKIQTP